MTQASADIVLVNARVITLDRRRPRAEALAFSAGRILAVGSRADLSALAGPGTTILDADGGVVVPAFHDAHLHLLSYARNRSRVDCRSARSILEIQSLLRERARSSPQEPWIRATGYDDLALTERRHPNRWDLDQAVSDRPVRLQHRSRHLDVFNRAGLEALGFGAPSAIPVESSLATIEREPDSDVPTGRIFNGGELLQRLRSQAPSEDLARDVRAASKELLSRGITTVQDATFTNRPNELDLFRGLIASGDLGVRVFMMRSARYWREFDEAESPELRLGPIKIMLDEATSNSGDVRRTVAGARAAGHAVAFHAVSEAEVALALDALRDAPLRASKSAGPDRIEHGAVIPDEWLDQLRELGACVVGQPSLVRDRGDIYRDTHSPEQHAWIHRARSLVNAGIPYAAGSDAPVTEPNPLLDMKASRTRRTIGGSLFGRDEALTPMQALAAFTLWPARAVGADRKLGKLRPGAVADVVVLDPDALSDSDQGVEPTTRLTIKDGRVVWRRALGRS